MAESTYTDTVKLHNDLAATSLITGNSTNSNNLDDPFSGPCAIVILLDESFSMRTNAYSMLNAMNRFINFQKSVPDDGSTLSILCFSTKVRVLIENTPIKLAPLFNKSDYHPDGSTALYDAIGTAIDMHQNRRRVVIAIVTDGRENASSIYSKENIKEKISMAKSRGCHFIFLANDLDTSAGGDDIGLSAAPPGSTTSCTNNISVGHEMMGDAFQRCVSDAVIMFRTSSQTPNLNNVVLSDVSSNDAGLEKLDKTEKAEKSDKTDKAVELDGKEPDARPTLVYNLMPLPGESNPYCGSTTHLGSTTYGEATMPRNLLSFGGKLQRSTNVEQYISPWDANMAHMIGNMISAEIDSETTDKSANAKKQSKQDTYVDLNDLIYEKKSTEIRSWFATVKNFFYRALVRINGS